MPRSIPASIFEPATAPRPTFAETIRSLFSGGGAELSPASQIERYQKAKLASTAISSCTLAAWLFLMLTVAAANGGLLEIAAITLIPFLAHVASMCLTAYSVPRESSDDGAAQTSRPI